jgi:hypothetical protein
LTGKGVFAGRDFCEGEFLLEYDGELVSFEEGKRRFEKYPSNVGSFIFLFNFIGKKYWYVDIICFICKPQ